MRPTCSSGSKGQAINEQYEPGVITVQLYDAFTGLIGEFESFSHHDLILNDADEPIIVMMDTITDIMCQTFCFSKDRWMLSWKRYVNW